MTERDLRVEKILIDTLNYHNDRYTLTFSLGDFNFGSNTVPLLANDKLKGQIPVGAIWPEWVGTYIICIGERRGLYLNWIEQDDKVLVCLTEETTHKKVFMNSKQLRKSVDFEILSQTIRKELSLPNDYAGFLVKEDGLPEGASIVYRFASSKPNVSIDKNGCRVDFSNATIKIPNEGEPSMETYDIFECVITHKGQEYHLGG